jgi:hypothetical protein
MDRGPGKATLCPMNFPLLSRRASSNRQLESQSVTVAAQKTGLLPSEAGLAEQQIP